jgi:hypothetical protein
MPPLLPTLPELAGRIRDAMATIIFNLLNNAWIEIEYRYATAGPLTLPSLNNCKM